MSNVATAEALALSEDIRVARSHGVLPREGRLFRVRFISRTTRPATKGKPSEVAPGAAKCPVCSREVWRLRNPALCNSLAAADAGTQAGFVFPKVSRVPSRQTAKIKSKTTVTRKVKEQAVR